MSRKQNIAWLVVSAMILVTNTIALGFIPAAVGCIVGMCLWFGLLNPLGARYAVQRIKPSALTQEEAPPSVKDRTATLERELRVGLAEPQWFDGCDSDGRPIYRYLDGSLVTGYDDGTALVVSKPKAPLVDEWKQAVSDRRKARKQASISCECGVCGRKFTRIDGWDGYHSVGPAAPNERFTIDEVESRLDEALEPIFAILGLPEPVMGTTIHQQHLTAHDRHVAYVAQQQKLKVLDDLTTNLHDVMTGRSQAEQRLRTERMRGLDTMQTEQLLDTFATLEQDLCRKIDTFTKEIR